MNCPDKAFRQSQLSQRPSLPPLHFIVSQSGKKVNILNRQHDPGNMGEKTYESGKNLLTAIKFPCKLIIIIQFNSDHFLIQRGEGTGPAKPRQQTAPSTVPIPVSIMLLR